MTGRALNQKAVPVGACFYVRSFACLEAGCIALPLILALVISLSSAQAFSGATVPWTTYEAENMATTGTVLGPQYGPNVVASESSGRKCVQLNATGQYVQFTAQAAANAIVVRYSVPDSADGVGTDSTISLYKNGAFVAKLPVTSRYSWLYGAYPFSNTPANGSPRNFYDEVRTNGLSISAGDVVRLQKDADDTASYYIIDLVDLENVAAPLTAPANSLSIMSYGAGGTGATDDTDRAGELHLGRQQPGQERMAASRVLQNNRVHQPPLQHHDSGRGHVAYDSGRRSRPVHDFLPPHHSEWEWEQHSSFGFCDYGEVELPKRQRTERRPGREVRHGINHLTGLGGAYQGRRLDCQFAGVGG